jgi:hypothetical protein
MPLDAMQPSHSQGTPFVPSESMLENYRSGLATSAITACRQMRRVADQHFNANTSNLKRWPFYKPFELR